MLVEEEHRLGGHLRWGGAAELAALAGLRDEVAAAPGIEVLTNSVVAGRYDDNWIAVVRRGGPGGRAPIAEQLIKARAKVLVVAPGLIERPYVFQGNDVPGVMLSTAVRRLIQLYAVRPGERAVVLTANADGDAAVADLRGPAWRSPGWSTPGPAATWSGCAATAACRPSSWPTAPRRSATCS